MKRIIYSIVSILIVHASANAQSDMEPIHTGVALFLTIPVDARTLGMGGTSVALPNPYNSVFTNGASILSGDTNTKNGVTYNYSPWMREYESGYNFHSLGGYHIINSRNAIFAGFRYYNYPKQEVIENGHPNGSYIHPNEWAVDLGYSRKIYEHLALSATVRLISSDMGSVGGAKSAKAIAFDIGAFYDGNLPLVRDAKWTAGMQLSNWGSANKYLNQKEDLPLTGKLGGSIYLPFSHAHTLTVAADLGYKMVPSDVRAVNISSGLEYTLLNHFIFRGGYHYGDENKADWSYTTAGMGIAYWKMRVDFAWLFAENNTPLNNTLSVSCSVNF